MFGTANGGNANCQNNGVNAGTIIHGTWNPGCSVVTYTYTMYLHGPSMNDGNSGNSQNGNGDNGGGAVFGSVANSSVMGVRTVSSSSSTSGPVVVWSIGP